MKRHGQLWPALVNYENLVRAHHNARKGKAHYREVQAVNAAEEDYLLHLQELLDTRQFTTSEYTIFEKHDGRKERTLYKLPYFPDRIVQHALIQVCEPIWRAGLIRDTYQSITGRGTSDARKRVERVVRGRPGLYALKFDVRKFYPSVDNEILKAIIRRKIKCPQTLWLIDNIIDSCAGIPIGNYTSQYWGNLYLSPFDWWVKQELRPYGYHRYCDDIILLGHSSHELHELRKRCFEKLATDFHLGIKPNWQVFPVDARGLDFCGYVFTSRSTRLRPTIARKLRAKARQIRRSHHQMTPHEIACGAGSYWGWCKHADARRLYFREMGRQTGDRIHESQERVRALQRAAA